MQMQVDGVPFLQFLGGAISKGRLSASYRCDCEWSAIRERAQSSGAPIRVVASQPYTRWGVPGISVPFGPHARTRADVHVAAENGWILLCTKVYRARIVVGNPSLPYAVLEPSIRTVGGTPGISVVLECGRTELSRLVGLLFMGLLAGGLLSSTALAPILLFWLAFSCACIAWYSYVMYRGFKDLGKLLGHLSSLLGCAVLLPHFVAAAGPDDTCRFERGG